MTTKLDKPVRRETVIFTDNREKARSCDHWIIELTSHCIHFRRKRSSTTYTMPLSEILAMAIKCRIKDQL